MRQFLKRDIAVEGLGTFDGLPEATFDLPRLKHATPSFELESHSRMSTLPEDEAVAASLTSLLRVVSDAEDFLGGCIDADGAFDMSATQSRTMATLLVRLHCAMADGRRALAAKHDAVRAADVVDANEAWGLSAPEAG